MRKVAVLINIHLKLGNWQSNQFILKWALNHIIQHTSKQLYKLVQNLELMANVVVVNFLEKSKRPTYGQKNVVMFLRCQFSPTYNQLLQLF